MKKRSWSARVVLRYTLFQLPALVILVLVLVLIRPWVDLPSWSIWVITGFWIVKDVILFPLVWRAYDRGKRPGDGGLMIGAGGIARGRLAPSGYVRVRGELWHAEVAEGGRPIELGEGVRVSDVRGLTLLVRPEDDTERR
jgi:membrane protein implicated in regulation of membrane protease activity